MIVLRILDYAETALQGLAVANSALKFFTPLSTGPIALGPLWALGSLLALALLAGVAVGSLTTLLFAVVALYYVVTQVLGFTLEISAPW